MELIHMTATYSNAMLVALLPHVSDCAKKLDLPIVQPITLASVEKFNPSPYKDLISGGLGLTNKYWFSFERGYVDMFRSPNDWFYNQELEGVERFAGEDNMTTNDAVELARRSFVKLGYRLDELPLTNAPTRIDGPFDTKKIGHVPFCSVVWQTNAYTVKFDINLESKTVVGMFLAGTNFWRASPQLGVVPELESDYLKRVEGHMYFRTNAPQNALERSAD
jgi:hypothetical protein